MSSRDARRLVALVLGLLGCFAVPSVAVDSFEVAPLEVPLPAFESATAENASSSPRASSASAQIAASLGGQWSVQSWNPLTDSPSAVYGSGVRVSAGFTDDAEVVETALDLATQQAAALGVVRDDLRFDTVGRGLGKVAAHFQQTWKGLDVYGGRYRALFTESGEVMVMGSDFYRDIELDPTPRVSTEAARSIAADAVGVPEDQRAIEGDSELLVLPVPTAADAVRFHLVQRVRVAITDRPEIWETYVDAHTGEIVWRYNDVHFHSGTSSAVVYESDVCTPQTTRPLAYMEVQVDGVGTTVTDANGQWSLAGSDSALVTANFRGPYCEVHVTPDGSHAQFSVPSDGSSPVVIDWDDTNSRMDERVVFSTVSDIHDFFESFAPGFGLSNRPIHATVGIDDRCNAYFSMGGIFFYRANGGCANSGEIASVVAHEYGHAVQLELRLFQGALGEGNADILSNFLLDDSVVSRGLFGSCPSGIRDSDNTLQYPADVVGKPIHSAGQVIAGAVWDVRQNLEASLGPEAGKRRAAELWHFGRVLWRPLTMPDQVFSMFVADDDDGDLLGGTPNFSDICAAVGSRGFDCIGQALRDLMIRPRPSKTPVFQRSFDVGAEIFSFVDGASVVPSSVRVESALLLDDFVVSTVTMNDDGGGLFSASVPFDMGGTEVLYRIIAEDNVGNVDSTAVLKVQNPNVYDDIECENSGWTVNLEGTDDATEGQWVRAVPGPDDVYRGKPGTDATPDDGVYAWVTGTPGVANSDVDGGTTTLYSPVFDFQWGGSLAPSVTYQRWYSNDSGNNPNLDTWVVQARYNGGPWVDVERTQANQNRWVSVGVRLIGTDPNGGVGIFENYPESFTTLPSTLQFRFIASDLGDASVVEAAVDDFMILAVQDDFDTPVVRIQHDPVLSPQQGSQFDVVADIETIACAGLDPSKIVVEYVVNDGSPSLIPMTHEGGNVYSAAIPLEANQEVVYRILAEDADGNASMLPSGAPDYYRVENPTIYDDVETVGQWIVNAEGLDDATQGFWELGAPIESPAQPGSDVTPAPGVNAWFTGQLNIELGDPEGFDSDVNDGSTSLYSPLWDASGHQGFAIATYHRWFMDNAANQDPFDQWVVQARNDGGPWVDVERTTEGQYGWVRVRTDLVDLFGDPGIVQFRFIVSDLGPFLDFQLVEAAVDEISFVLGSTESATSVDLPGATPSVVSHRLYDAIPNPFNPSTTIRFDLLRAAPVVLTIYDVAGRRVRTLVEEFRTAGPHEVTWSGRDQNGRGVASGLYLYELRAGDFVETRRMTLLK